jgi:hypothetical protein
MTAKTINNGKKFQNQFTTLEETPAQTKEIRIFKSMWPDSILANRRIAKLNILEKYEIYSINMRKGTIGNGTPSGKNSTKKASLW